jgi:hypothetical protein
MDSPWRAPAYGEQLDCIAALLQQVIRELQAIRETPGGQGDTERAS